MNQEGPGSRPANTDRWLEVLFRQPSSHFNLLLVVILLAYGYEFFGFHLTIDEEIHADYRGWIVEWLNQGRWGMALLSLFMPSAIVPAVSPILGIGLTALAWWLLLAKVLRFGNTAATLAVSATISFPTLAFTISFSTLAYGFGVGNLCLLFFAIGLTGNGRKSWALAIFAGAMAIAIYQTFLIPLVLLCLVDICLMRREHFKRQVLTDIALLFGAVLVCVIVDKLARGAFGTPVSYVGGFVDLNGLLNDPAQRIDLAFKALRRIIGLSSSKFGLSSPWFSVLTLLSLGVCAMTGLRRDGSERWAIPLLILSVLTLLLAAEAITPSGAPLRSVFYIAMGIAIFIACAMQADNPRMRMFLALAVVPAVVGNAVITNSLFNSSAMAYRFDQRLATEIGNEIRRLSGSAVPPGMIEIVGAPTFFETKLLHRRETIGASFFEWEGGNPNRVAMLLRLEGLQVVAADAAARARVAEKALSMPTWPAPGWVGLDGSTIILKFSSYTDTQAKALCDQGVSSVCRNR